MIGPTGSRALPRCICQRRVFPRAENESERFGLECAMEPTLSENPPGRILSSASPKLSEAEVRTGLEKVLASDRFRPAEGLKRFLRYTVEHTLRGEGDQLKEYRIGVEVLDRDPSFDPRLDPAVRMAARRLRAKLQEYYETEGRKDPVRIEIPKGGYAATFSH